MCQLGVKLGAPLQKAWDAHRLTQATCSGGDSGGLVGVDSPRNFAFGVHASGNGAGDRGFAARFTEEKIKWIEAALVAAGGSQDDCDKFRGSEPGEYGSYFRCWTPR
jgi:hypothetical protein